MIQNKNILITGATGFIGYHLVKKLIVANNIFCIVRASSDIRNLKQFSNIVFIHYDGNLFSLKKQIQGLNIHLTYHVASLVIAEHNSSQVDDLILSNILFPIQLLDVLSECGYLNFVNTGTFWQTYSATDHSPVCLYAATKQSFEDVIQYYSSTKKISCITLRLYDTYGSDDHRKKLFWLLDNVRLTGKMLNMSMGEQRINLVYIDDVISAFIIAGDKLLNKQECVNEVYGVYSDVDYSLREVVQLYEDIYGVNLDVKWGSKPYRAREVMQHCYNLELLDGWHPQINLKKGINILAHGNIY